MTDLENYIPIKKNYYEFIEFGADIKYMKKGESTIGGGGYIIGNHELKDGQGRYFIIRQRTSPDRFFIIKYNDIKKLYKKKVISDFLLGNLTTKN